MARSPRKPTAPTPILMPLPLTPALKPVIRWDQIQSSPSDDDFLDDFEDDEESPRSREDDKRPIIGIKLLKIRPGDAIPAYGCTSLHTSPGRWEAHASEKEAERTVNIWMERIQKQIAMGKATLQWWRETWSGAANPPVSKSFGFVIYPLFTPEENELGEVSP